MKLIETAVRSARGNLRCVMAGALIGVAAWGSGKSEGEYMGAAQFLAEVQAATNDKPRTQPKEEKETLESLSKHADRTFKNLHRLEPKEAAAQWFDILTRYWELEKRHGARGGYYEADPVSRRSLLSESKLFSNLPGPDTWPELQRLARETTAPSPTKKAGIEMLMAKLNNDIPGMETAFEALQTAMEKDYGRRHAEKSVSELRELLFRDSVESDSPVARFEAEIKKRRKDTERNYNQGLLVPDLVSLTDENTARRLLRLALALPATRLEIHSRPTQVLAQEVALENLRLLDKPRWDLVLAPGSSRLYEAMQDRFQDALATASETLDEPTAEESVLSLARLLTGSRGSKAHSYLEDLDNSDAKRARAYYYLDLLREGREEEADKELTLELEFINQLNYIIPEALEELPPSVVYEKLTSKMADQTTLPLRAWRLTSLLSRMVNDRANFTAKLQQAISSGGIEDDELDEAYDLLANALLELNQPDRAVEMFEQAIAAAAPGRESRLDQRGTLIVRLGRALNRPEWVDNGIKHLINDLSQLKDDDQVYPYMYKSRYETLTQAFLAAGRGEEAEAFLLDQMKNQDGSDEATALNIRQEILKNLAVVYDKAGRSDDVAVLLNNAPWWRADDVVQLLESSFHVPLNSERWGVPVAIARALHADGREQEAITVLRRCLVMDASADELYDALTSMTGTALIPWLEDLATRDRFEERPFIWKAILLQRDGQLDAAEAAARQAMDIDPTDGEAPRGRRLLAYGVLAEILADKNEMEEAEKLLKVVAAVRLAELGDELNDLGLVDQAIETYDQASRDFSDAYCVEWRLARRLQERGEEEEATRHYRKAFELMPNQFGRLSNLCFGCENIFELHKPRSIAEEILQRMVAEPDVKPTVYHLLGQLREAQSLYSEAADYYRKAVEIDPHYFDGWDSLYDMAERASLSNEEKTSISIQLMKLDPHMKHFTPSSELDIPAAVLWNAKAVDRKWLEPLEDPIFTLEVSKAYLEELQNKANKNRDRQSTHNLWVGSSSRKWEGPAELLTQTRWFRIINIM